MAVIVPTYTVPDTGVVLTNAYLRVRDTIVNEDKQRLSVVIEVYNTQADRVAGKKPVHIIEREFGQAAFAALRALIKDRAEQRVLTQFPGSTQIAGD